MLVGRVDPGQFVELVEGRRRGCTFLHKPVHPMDLRQVLGRIRSGEAA